MKRIKAKTFTENLSGTNTFQTKKLGLQQGYFAIFSSPRTFLPHLIGDNGSDVNLLQEMMQDFPQVRTTVPGEKFR